MLTIPYITAAFLSTTSFGFPALFRPVSVTVGMMSLCLATANGPQGLEMRSTTGEPFVLLDFTTVLEFNTIENIEI